LSGVNSSIKALSLLGLLAVALGAAACSTDAAPATPSTTPTTTTTGATTTTTPVNCTYSLSPTSLSVLPAGGASTVTVTTQSGCSWVSSTPSSFITVTSGASGSGNGSVGISVAANSGTTRTGTVTIAGQTLNVSQTGAGIIVAFEMLDPPTQAGPVAACRIRGLPGYPISTCPLTTASRTTGTNSIVNWAWTITYTYDGAAKTQTQNTGSIQNFQFYEYCGRPPSSAAGTVIPIAVSLTVTDNNGIQATATSGTGNQPALSMVAYTCGS